MTKRIETDWYIDGCYPECHLRGEKFYPSKLAEIQDLIISDSIDRGEIGTSGLYKNQPTSYGACTIVAPKEIERVNVVIWMADFIKKNKLDFERAGATKMLFWILWYGGQGNMELSTHAVKAIHETGLALCMDYIFIE